MEISLEDVWHTYDGSTYVLKNINLTFKDPGLYMIVGPNGSGKTTLLKIISLIIKPSRGRVLTNGKDFWGLNEEYKHFVRKNIVYVHDKPTLLRGSAKYNIELGLKLRDEDRENDLKNFILRYNLKEFMSKPVTKLSAGQAKIVSIIRALLLKPKVLVLDEPFTFLDSEKTKLLIEDILNIIANGSITIIATHYILKELEKHIKNLVEIVDGEITCIH